MAREETIPESELETGKYSGLNIREDEELHDTWKNIIKHGARPYRIPVNQTEEKAVVIEGEERIDYFDKDEIPCQVVEVGKAKELILAVGFNRLTAAINRSKVIELLEEQPPEVLEELKEHDIDGLESLVSAIEKLQELESGTDGPMELDEVNNYGSDDDEETETLTVRLKKSNMETVREAMERVDADTNPERVLKMAKIVLDNRPPTGTDDLSKSREFDKVVKKTVCPRN